MKTALPFLAVSLLALPVAVQAAGPATRPAAGKPATRPASRPDFENMTALLKAIPKEAWRPGLEPKDRAKIIDDFARGKSFPFTHRAASEREQDIFLVQDRAPASIVGGLRVTVAVALDATETDKVAIRKAGGYSGVVVVVRVAFQDDPYRPGAYSLALDIVLRGHRRHGE